MDDSQIVVELYALGLTAKEIAELTNELLEWIEQEIRKSGGAEAFPNRPKQSGVFAAALHKFAVVDCVWATDKEMPPLRYFLGKHIREERIRQAIEGLELMISRLSRPAFAPDHAGYAQLITEICPRRFVGGTTGDQEWRLLLRDIAQGDTPASSSYDELLTLLVDRVLSTNRPKIMPIWDDQVIKAVNRLLDELSTQKADILRKRFGIGHRKWTRREIGEKLFLKTSVIEQIEKRALAKLRRLVKLGGLQILVEPIGNVLEWQLTVRDTDRWERPADTTRILCDFQEMPVMGLLVEVKTLPLSILATRFLEEAGITYIGDLIALTEDDVRMALHHKRLPLKQIKSWLEQNGLSLETDPKHSSIRAFRAVRPV